MEGTTRNVLARDLRPGDAIPKYLFTSRMGGGAHMLLEGVTPERGRLRLTGEDSRLGYNMHLPEDYLVGDVFQKLAAPTVESEAHFRAVQTYRNNKLDSWGHRAEFSIMGARIAVRRASETHLLFFHDCRAAADHQSHIAVDDAYRSLATQESIARTLIELHDCAVSRPVDRSAPVRLGQAMKVAQREVRRIRATSDQVTGTVRFDGIQILVVPGLTDHRGEGVMLSHDCTISVMGHRTYVPDVKRATNLKLVLTELYECESGERYDTRRLTP